MSQQSTDSFEKWMHKHFKATLGYLRALGKCETRATKKAQTHIGTATFVMTMSLKLPETIDAHKRSQFEKEWEQYMRKTNALVQGYAKSIFKCVCEYPMFGKCTDSDKAMDFFVQLRREQAELHKLFEKAVGASLANTIEKRWAGYMTHLKKLIDVYQRVVRLRKDVKCIKGQMETQDSTQETEAQDRERKEVEDSDVSEEGEQPDDEIEKMESILRQTEQELEEAEREKETEIVLSKGYAIDAGQAIDDGIQPT